MGKLLRWAVPVVFGLWMLVNTFDLKTISYDKIPKEGQTFDEYAFAWMGKSFLESGKPMSWTTNLEVYKQEALANGSGFSGFGLEVEGQKPTWRNMTTLPKPVVMVTEFDYGLGKRQVGVVQPYFDHPPLAGIVYSLGLINSTDIPTEITAEDFRYMNRYLGVITAGLLFVLAARLFSPWAGLMAAGIYSTTPSTLLSSRLTLAENVLIPVMLLALICIQLALKPNKQKWWVVAGVMAGVGMLVKMSGVSILLTGVFLAWQQKIEFKKWWGFLAAGIGTYMIYIIYGSWLSGGLFWQVILAQSGRAGWGIVNLYQGLERLFFNGFPIDGWWTGGLAVTMYLTSRQLKNFQIVAVMVCSYILTAVLLGGDNNAWYLFPLGALGCLAFAGLISDLVKNPNLFNSGLFFLFGLMSSAYWGFFKLRPDLNMSWATRIMAVVFIGGALLSERFEKKYPWIRYAWIVIVAVVLHRIYVWNIRGMQFIFLNWGKLPFPLMWQS